MHSRRMYIHRRSTTSTTTDGAPASSSFSNDFSSSNSSTLSAHNTTRPDGFSKSSEETPVVTPLQTARSSSFFTPVFTPSSHSSVPRTSITSSPSTSISTSTIYEPQTTITLTAPIPHTNSSRPSSSPSRPVPLTLTSRDGIIILCLSIFAGILSFLCICILWRRCRRSDQSDALENRVDPVSFHRSGTLISRRTARGNTESFACLTSLSLDNTLPSDIKSRLRERESPSHWSSHDSIPSPPITPTHNPSRCSPVPDIFDTRWPGRLVPLNPSQRGSGLTVDGSQIVVVSGGLSLQSHQSDPASGSQAATATTTLAHLQTAPPENNPSGPDPVITADITHAKNELENQARQRLQQRRELDQAGGGTWDEPPPEESDKADSSKTGPPAYSPGSDSMAHSIPPLPLPLGGIRPLPIPTGGSRSRSRGMGLRRGVH